MKYIFSSLIILLILVPPSINRNFGDTISKPVKLQDSTNDGPYVLFRNDSVIEFTIINNEVQKKVLDPDGVQTSFEVEPSIYENIERLAVLSDVHGQYNLTSILLKNNGIVDDQLNWNYGDGHLVIVGDIFDRGPQVTELFWLVYTLEQQAEKAGGKVHFTLGNHEYMVMNNDLRYINRKYRVTERLLETSYDQLYNENTLLGRWLRSKNTVLKINDHLFVHAGISPEFIDHDFDLDNTNAQMRKSLDSKLTAAQRDSIYNKFYNAYGPIWYRGYFNDDLKKGVVKRLLKKLNVSQIIVGHTSQPRIMSFFNNKIMAVDTSIKNGINGEVLFIEKGIFYRGKLDGSREIID